MNFATFHEVAHELVLFFGSDSSIRVLRSLPNLPPRQNLVIARGRPIDWCRNLDDSQILPTDVPVGSLRSNREAGETAFDLKTD